MTTKKDGLDELIQQLRAKTDAVSKAAREKRDAEERLREKEVVLNSELAELDAIRKQLGASSEPVKRGRKPRAARPAEVAA